jgi:hypothetical protein
MMGLANSVLGDNAGRITEVATLDNWAPFRKLPLKRRVGVRHF